MDAPPAIIQYYDLSKESLCGGGYTDKYGTQWNWHGRYPNCKYFPSRDERMLEEYKNDHFWIRNNQEPPPEDQRIPEPLKQEDQ